MDLWLIGMSADKLKKAVRRYRYSCVSSEMSKNSALEDYREAAERLSEIETDIRKSNIAIRSLESHLNFLLENGFHYMHEELGQSLMEEMIKKNELENERESIGERMNKSLENFFRHSSVSRTAEKKVFESKQKYLLHRDQMQAEEVALLHTIK